MEYCDRKKKLRSFKFQSCLYVVLGLLVFLTGCPKTANKAQPQGMVYYNFFDTVSFIYSYAGDSEEAFAANCEQASQILETYHNLFDIYYEYSGVNNLCTVNKNAGGEAIPVDKELIDFLLYAKQLYETTNGEMNIMMGSVLKLWHDCRTLAGEDPQNAAIPPQEQLAEAAKHTDISLLEIDEEACTVRISDPEAAIDVGALGKGYATEKAAQYLRSIGAEGYVLNIGGNIRTIGTKPDGTGWSTGVKNPLDPEQYVLTIQIADTSCVTSGDYERYFTVDGKRYHHIIDKDTWMPATYFSAITVITPDSAVADALSTALFTMSYEDGAALVEKIGGVEVLWITPDGTQYRTEGFSKLSPKDISANT
jgi:thiamine biosynthesis lipoprotein